MMSNPLEPDDPVDLEPLVTEASGDTRVTFKFVRDPRIEGVTHRVEGSDLSGGWAPLTVVDERVVPVGDHEECVYLSVVLDAALDLDRYFLRLVFTDG